MPVLPGYMGLHLLSGLRRGCRLPDKEIKVINKQFLFTITIIGEGGPILVFPHRSDTSTTSADIWHSFRYRNRYCDVIIYVLCCDIIVKGSGQAINQWKTPKLPSSVFSRRCPWPGWHLPRGRRTYFQVQTARLFHPCLLPLQ